MMRRYTLYNIYKATRTLLLATGLLLAGGGVAWGQEDRINEEVIPNSEITEILYVVPGEPKTIEFQTNDASDKLDGYIRWYVESADGTRSITGLTEKNEFDEYSNGLAWYRSTTDHEDYPKNACSITCKFAKDQIEKGITLVYDASSASADREQRGIGRDQYWFLTPHSIGVRHKYIIKNAGERSEALKAAKDSLEKIGGSNISSDISTLLKAPNKSACVLHTYTIHTPIQNGTNYRLPERLDNYYMGTTPQVAQHVRWTMYGEKGDQLAQEENEANILSYTFDITDMNTTVSHKRYILTEVSADNSTWYPVSLLNIILEPFSLPLTESELDGFRSNPNYKDRFEDSLLVDGRYELLENISFEEQDEILSKDALIDNPSLNYRQTPLIADSYYAFAAPQTYADKRDNRLSVGRGEYALYRTLNYTDISRRGVNYSGGEYIDYFPIDGYNIAVVDRLNETTNRDEFGYFMYLDAADEPGVITKIPVENLCANTSLIVSAWICDLAHKNGTNPGVHADVGFTFKRIDYDDKGDSTEVILTKYYTGALSHKPVNPTNDHPAFWQQVSFKFSFSNAEISNDERSRYILEISNNCPSSNGADYGIDEIKVYRSLPNIDVQRKDACDASTLIVSSSYETLLHNMGWDLNPDILTGLDLETVSTRKYRYGLMGDDPNADIETINMHVGNIYYGFVEDTTKSGADEETWITVNKDPDVAQLGLSKSIRVAVPTSPGEYIATTGGTEGLPTSRAKALEAEITMNLRAINDYNADTQRGPEGNKQPYYWPDAEKIDITGLQNSDGTLKASSAILADADLLNLYNAKIKELYSILHVPRIRCPWTEDGGKTICLSAIDVEDTDLKFWNELIGVDADGNNEYASGKYFVVLFSAADVLGSNNLTSSVVNLRSKCTLISEFYVLPSIRIVVNTKTETGGVTCIGEIHNMDAHLTAPAQDEYGNIIDDKVMEDLEKLYPGTEYTFDWFLGPETEYLKVLEGVSTDPNHIDLKSIIADLRTAQNLGVQPITEAAIDAVNTNVLNDAEKQLLKRLLNEGKLLTGKQVSFQFIDQIVAMPYVSGRTGLLADQADKLYCTDAQVVDLPTQSNVPELSVGFPNVQYADSWTVPLRLGLPNIRSGKTLADIPIQNAISFGMDPADDHCLKHVTANDTIFLVTNSADPAERYIPVAKLTNLYADNNEADDKNNVLSLVFDNTLRTGETLNWSDVFGTEQIYSLLIPFGEYESAGATDPIPGSCMGYARLLIKIVPEYLTWKGDDTGSWYSDNANWHRSTKGEIFLDASGQSTEDANGYSYPMSAAFSPLYFTKITIPDSKQLALQDEKELRKDVVLPLDHMATDSIAYDMAVDSVSTDRYEIVPYYGNKVREIYFKPGATLMSQQYLTYDTARVEFTMKEDSSYWMSSPLKSVYAGDMYTLSDGVQNTPAFDYITYQEGTNSRWDPAFYQKAWDKAVAYAVSNTEDGTAVKDTGRVAAVKSNWSIEYNDVWVPYTLGKGFYARVAGKGATVRLPKADLDYKYESAPATRAAGPELSPQPTERDSSGRLANGEAIAITLENDVDGDGTHYLVGNPYMTYLNMHQFFNGTNNQSLQKKYWKLDRERGIEAIVGTPDVGWTGTETEDGAGGKAISGFIAPMEAFFVEVDPATVAPDKPAVVNFNTGMMATKAEATATSPVTRSISATSPVLTLTADRDGKKGRSVITLRDKASNAYQPQEDAVVLLDSELYAPVAYSVAGNRAVQVNALRSIDNIPIGVYNSRKGDVTVTIEGMDQLAEPLYLYDAYTRKSTLLEGDSHTLEISGESHGRYYLRSSAIGSVGDNAIAIYSVQSGKVIVSSTQEVRNIKVYSLSGAMVKNYMNLNTTQYTFNLPAGVYVVHAEGKDGAVKVEKVIVR